MPIKRAPFSATLGPLSLAGGFVKARFTPAWIAKVRVTQQYVEVIHSGSNNKARVTQQAVEVIHSGGNNKARVTQQAVEVIHSGGNNKVRVTQQFLEVIHTFGTPPIIGPGNSDKAHDKSPGQQKKNDASRSHVNFIRMRATKRDKFQGQFIGGAGAMFGPTSHVPPPLPPRPLSRPETRIITRS